jgi:tRNA-2-methylthio-N6-dimethylallyladenosine synthase
MSKKLFIQTLGCQMNVRDSEHIIAELKDKKDYELIENLEDADLILINTCSVREKPVQKLFSEIGMINKKKKDNAKIGICGCTASHLGDDIIKKAPSVDFVLGARNVSKITEVIDKKGAVEININYDESQYLFNDYRSNPYKSLVNISIGCDKKCTFCIVPNTRGEEISIPSSLIINEIKKSVQHGVQEIFLLGQNVNNYGRRFSDQNEKKLNFTQLLQEISKIDEIKRIRFTSPHPLHMDDEFINEFATNNKICKSIHMPLQSGSTKVLKDMKRGYTKEWFLNRAKLIRELVPNVSISTDIIVGFPGENDEDFADTIDVINEVKFEQIFNFKYSPRPHTAAIDFENSVPNDIASKRLEEVIELHKVQLQERVEVELGKVHEVMFENLIENNQVSGRSDNNFNVKVNGSEELLGQTKKVKITKVNRMHLFGELIEC